MLARNGLWRRGQQEAQEHLGTIKGGSCRSGLVVGHDVRKDMCGLDSVLRWMLAFGQPLAFVIVVVLQLRTTPVDHKTARQYAEASFVPPILSNCAFDDVADT